MDFSCWLLAFGLRTKERIGYYFTLWPLRFFLPRHELVADMQADGGHVEDKLPGGFVFVGECRHRLVVDRHPLGEIHVEVEAKHEVVTRVLAVY